MFEKLGNMKETKYNHPPLLARGSKSCYRVNEMDAIHICHSVQLGFAQQRQRHLLFPGGWVSTTADRKLSPSFHSRMPKGMEFQE